MGGKEILFGLFVAILLALIVSPFASPWPDGLEKVAADKNFLEKGNVKPIVEAPVPDYAWPGVIDERLTTSFAGAAGTLAVFGMGCAVAVLLRRRGKP